MIPSPRPSSSEHGRLHGWLPAVLALAVFAGSLTLYFALKRKQDRQIIQTVRAAAYVHDLPDAQALDWIDVAHRVRDDTGYWSQIDTYLRKHTKAALSHSYCPECAAKFYKECGFEVPEKVKAEIAAGNFE